MAYFVKEAFRTLQGEGLNAGRVAVFCRFAGCNLWSGREADRAVAVRTLGLGLGHQAAHGLGVGGGQAQRGQHGGDEARELRDGDAAFSHGDRSFA